MLNTPILFLIFNRPDLTEKVFETIRQAKPKKLFVSADGPRLNKEGEDILCKKTRDIVLNNIDWDCEVFSLLRDENLGCKIAVSTAITWFFDNVEEGIVLEDDTLPSKSFFTYCNSLLEYYRNDNRVSFISGCCLPDSANHLETSYYFSKFSIIWGWASWKRVWLNYDVTISDWVELSHTNWLRNVFYGNEYFANGFKDLFDVAYNGYDTWDFQFIYLNLKSNSLNIHPSKNLIKNIGFDDRATHTHSIQVYSNQEFIEMKGELIHPLAMNFDFIADKIIFDTLYAYDDRPPSWFRTIIKKFQAF